MFGLSQGHKIAVIRSLPILLILPLDIALAAQAQVQLVPLLKRFQTVPEIKTKAKNKNKTKAKK